ncbi:hypothetical protein ACWDGI_43140 [Streptomyces sp. NPDC001220]
MRHRFQRAVDEGDLPADADPGLLARYLMTVANGIAVQAAEDVRVALRDLDTDEPDAPAGH